VQGMAIKPIAVDIDVLEREATEAPQPGTDVILMPIAIPTYKALSDAAARKNMTVAQLFARAITMMIEEE